MNVRIEAPRAFEAFFEGPEGRYQIRYSPTNDWDGILGVTIGDLDLTWHVLTIEQEERSTRICGMTQGTKELWGDYFWFELVCGVKPECIRYYGDRVLLRDDPAIETHS